MKLLLILVGFFACMSVERVGFRKWSFVFLPGILFLVVMVALVCAGCGPGPRVGDREPINPGIYRDIETGCDYLARGNNQGGLTPRMGADGKQICRKPAL